MGMFEAGRDFEKLQARVARLERKTSECDHQILADYTPKPVPPRLDPHSKEEPHSHGEIVWNEPFEHPVEWQYRDYGRNAHDISITHSFNPNRGEMSLRLLDDTRGPGDDLRGEKGHGCRYEIVFTGPLAKLQATGILYITTPRLIHGSTVNPASIDHSVSSRVAQFAYMNAWMWSGNAWGLLKHIPYTIITSYHNATQRSNLTGATRTIKFGLSSKDVDCLGKRLSIQVGIMNEMSFKADDYSVYADSNCRARLFSIKVNAPGSEKGDFIEVDDDGEAKE